MAESLFNQVTRSAQQRTPGGAAAKIPTFSQMTSGARIASTLPTVVTAGRTAQGLDGGTGGGGGSTGGGGGAAPDPYAAWGGQAKYNTLVDDFNKQKNNIYGSATDSANAINSQMGRSITDFLDSQRLAQSSIDSNAAKNYLAKQQGVAGIMGSVGRGIRSSGVMLANKNAGNSSAAGAIAAAYGDQGRRQMGSVGNQFELGKQEVQESQDKYNMQRASGVRALQGTKQDKINELVLGARDKFAQLDAAMANASLPGRIAIDQEREKVRQQVVGQLQGLDQQLNSGIAGIQAQSEDQRMEKASAMGRAGQDLGADAFQYTTEVPLEQQNTGPFASELPLFSLNRGKRTIA